MEDKNVVQQQIKWEVCNTWSTVPAGQERTKTEQ